MRNSLDLSPLTREILTAVSALPGSFRLDAEATGRVIVDVGKRFAMVGAVLRAS